MSATDIPVILCDQCKQPFVLRVAFTGLDLQERWVYQRDCKHRSASHTVREDPAPFITDGAR